ncbi:MAG: ATP-binding protein [Acidimicrobiia bacterium]|nr:ATP-binding protein [Acidimicrobiia bacterium]
MILAQMHRLSVSVQEDHLQALARSPLQGLAELIWNSLDADADDIEVIYERNALDGIEAVRVIDDGHGMTPAHIDDVFRAAGRVLEAPGRQDEDQGAKPAWAERTGPLASIRDRRDPCRVGRP